MAKNVKRKAGRLPVVKGKAIEVEKDARLKQSKMVKQEKQSKVVKQEKLPARVPVKKEDEKPVGLAKPRSKPYKKGERSAAKLREKEHVEELTDAALQAKLMVHAKEHEINLLNTAREEAAMLAEDLRSVFGQRLQCLNEDSALVVAKDRADMCAEDARARVSALAERFAAKDSLREQSVVFLRARVSHLEDCKDFRRVGMTSQASEAWALSEAVKRLEILGYSIVGPSLSTIWMWLSH